jgi:hypothetical protein
MTLIRNQLRDLIMYRFENWCRNYVWRHTATIEKIGFFENEYANSNSINNDEELAARLKVSDKIYFSLDGKTFLDLVVTDKPLAKFAYNVYSTKSEKITKQYWDLMAINSKVWKKHETAMRMVLEQILQNNF